MDKSQSAASASKASPATPSARKQREEEKRARQLAEQERLDAEFQAQRPAIWQRLWIGALELALNVAQRPDHVELMKDADHFWQHFAVDTVAKRFEMDRYGYLSEATLAREHVEKVDEMLHAGWQYVHFYEQRIAAEKREREERQANLQSAREKLTVGELAALSSLSPSELAQLGRRKT